MKPVHFLLTLAVGGLVALFGYSLGASETRAKLPAQPAVIVLQVDPSVGWQMDRMCAAWWTAGVDNEGRLIAQQKGAR